MKASKYGRIIVASAVGAFAVWVGTLNCEPARRPPFFSYRGVDHDGVPTGQPLAKIDAAGNSVWLDEPSGSLFVELAGGAWFLSNRHDGVELGHGPQTRYRYTDLRNTLLIGRPDGSMREFSLPQGAAQAVFQAVRDRKCEDVRRTVVELYRGDHVQALRSALGMDDVPASAPDPP